METVFESKGNQQNVDVVRGLFQSKGLDVLEPSLFVEGVKEVVSYVGLTNNLVIDRSGLVTSSITIKDQCKKVSSASKLPLFLTVS